MRLHFFIACLLLCAGCKSPDRQVTNSVKAFTEALSEQDTKKLSSLLTEDVTEYDLYTQDALSGKENVSASLINLIHPQDIHFSIEKVKTVGPDIVDVKGLLELKDKQYAFSLELVREDGTFHIAKIRHLLLEQAPSYYEHLKGLSWLVGSWQSRDADTTFKAIYRWGLNKNVLKQAFTLNVLGHKELSGEQIISWDPKTKTIRSIIFDSDGTIGSGIWAEDDKSWYATMSYTFSDGKKAACTNVFTKIDDNTYTFSSVNRDVNGTILPDMGPFHITRKGG